MAAEIVKVHIETLPTLRLIGKRCLCSPKDFGAKWNEWLKEGWFEQIRKLGAVPENGAVYLGATQPDSWYYWIGLLFSPGTHAPEGFEYEEIPESDYAVFELFGKKTGELFGEEGITLCMAEASKRGLVMKEKGWGIERYIQSDIPNEKGNLLFEFLMAIE